MVPWFLDGDPTMLYGVLLNPNRRVVISVAIVMISGGFWVGFPGRERIPGREAG
jgi:hypothetical protein